jgi:hypothetical protein
MADLSKFTPHRSGPTTRRAMTTRHPRREGDPLMLFALVAPDGRLASVIEADSIASAWTTATGWGDEDDIAEMQVEGWEVHPAGVTWEDEG